ncbi:hypothetical protein PS659_03009 [Pseudomonas fluorescens]|uniref:Uncharacterized protein n=1 Tax=Pseudomonas fluorescens TaxID=294 RepID=A0A5E6TM75_PSEFL|nr:hypothetical protein PS659_03009 [Pseudomonas fluorescens]
MLRRITRLIPLLAILPLSGCIVFPHGGWHQSDDFVMRPSSA